MSRLLSAPCPEQQIKQRKEIELTLREGVRLICGTPAQKGLVTTGLGESELEPTQCYDGLFIPSFKKIKLNFHVNFHEKI